MAEIFIAALSPTGHVGPLLSVAQDLVARGDRVTMTTGAAHTAAILAVGAHPHPLPPSADVDDSPFDASDRGRTRGPAAMNRTITRLLLPPMSHQFATLRAAMARTRFDAIIVDYGFFGVLPMLLDASRDLPPVLYYTPTPPMLSSRDTAPGGMGLAPGRGRAAQLRNRALNTLSQRLFLRRSHRTADAMLAEMGVGPLPVFLLDVGILADRFIVPTVPSFEYPRSDLAANVRFVGAVHPPVSPDYRLPDWWRDLDANRPVIHVTQGTVDTKDLSCLIEPTIAALARDDVLVVATTGGTAPRGRLPANVPVAEHIPHDILLPRVDVMVTNGGYGAVQRALSTGVPLVVAGGTEDKPEVAARVAWSGAGIDLRTGTPTPTAIRGAVRKVLSDLRYLRRARELECAFARRDGIAEIAALVDEVITERRTASHPRNSARASWTA